MSATETSPWKTDLFAAGGKNPIDVGDILVWNTNSTLYVEFRIEDKTPNNFNDNWYISETHLAVDDRFQDIPQNRQGNPKVGLFDYQGTHDLATSVLYQVSLQSESLDPGDLAYIAAHAVVDRVVIEKGIDGSSPQDCLATLENALPDTVQMTPNFPGLDYGEPSYCDIIIDGGAVLKGIYDGNCVDTDHGIYSGETYTANVYSSYEPLPSHLLEQPENLDLVNYIYNQHYTQKTAYDAQGNSLGTFTYGDIQEAIWTLVDDQVFDPGSPTNPDRIDIILNEARNNGEGFIPDCDQLVGIILEPIDGSQVLMTAVPFDEIGTPTIAQTETAWGNGQGFPGRSWATYFQYVI